MMLRSERVARLLREGEKASTKDPLVIVPQPDIAQLRRTGAAAVDLRLGTWFVTLREARIPCLSPGVHDKAEQLTKTQFVQFGEEFFLHPGSFVLGTTLEWLRLPRNIAGYVVGRSSWGRRGLIIATATGVHPGFIGCLTLELCNLGQVPIAIRPGWSICQLFLHSASVERSTSVDGSMFGGYRRPTIGRIDEDSFARRLKSVSSRPEAGQAPKKG